MYLSILESQGRVGASRCRMHRQSAPSKHEVSVLKVATMQETLMEQSKGRIINEWDILDENLHRQEAAMPFSQFVSR